MSRGDKDPVLRMFFIREVGAAVEVGENNGTTGLQFQHFIPRSQIGYAKKIPNDTPGALQHYHFSLPEWLIEKEQLWKFVP